MNLDKIKGFISQLFSELNNEDSYIVCFFLVSTFLLGLIFGGLSRRRKIKRLKKEIKNKENELITVRTENGAYKEQLELKEEALQTAQLFVEESKNNVDKAVEETRQIQAEIANTRSIAKRIRTENENLQTQLKEASSAKNQLETEKKAASLSASSSKISSIDPGSTNRIDAIESKLNQLEQENLSLKNNMRGTGFSDAGLTSIKAQLEQLELENNRLNKELTGLKVSGDTPLGLNDISSEQKSLQAKNAVSAIIGTRIKKSSEAEKDDLKIIVGIGPFIEKKLNNIGIYTYDQIAQFDQDAIDKITEAIQFFPGRINRDDWVGQVKEIIR